ncbi:hypothetical protein A7A08_02682 [Methyloligella halotolerans]|uniref:DUF2059 domain-containing protein n=1 Tax=Methyloligella halotolerans TaxID=1177755 RepID=A0A1E2RWT7_9HYPH|nr:DUF2059 domain-containing protein [Methyloligella halotolerans]ODA66558.1 hypothetical protein A7A08_02682 [Methyloligella halotolerans]
MKIITRSILALMLTAGLVLTAGPSSFAQEGSDAKAASDAADSGASEKKAELAREYLELTHQLATAEAIAMAVGSQIIRQRPESKLDVEDAAEAVAPKFEDQVNEMNEQVVAVYTKRFTADELQTMVDFHKEFNASAAGKKLQAENEEIAREMGDISRVRGVVIGGEVYRALVDELSAREQPVESPE